MGYIVIYIFIDSKVFKKNMDNFDIEQCDDYRAWVEPVKRGRVIVHVRTCMSVCF